MDGWLFTWLPAGHERIDRVVTILPAQYTTDDVAIVLRALFFVGTLTIGETIVHLRGNEVTPRVRQHREENGYMRMRIELGSDVMEARLARNIRVSSDSDFLETITWEEQTYRGEWMKQSFTRTVTGSITFDVD